ncbi:DUF4142 domain-containing protein [Ramlibacter sp. MMS24-I3-19]|uniref:DUF4142 domain-containing protein n=1 Tax=Ramlibacter sp. MMS24-I3-19 TaxID=3416606 RepID=UPI003CFE9AA0
MQLPAPAASPPAKPAAAPRTVRRAGGVAYAAEAAASSSRLPMDERATRAFLRSAAVSARVEADASRLAMVRAQDPALRGHAEELSRYRAEADLELLRLLHDRGMAPPMLETGQRKALNRLAKLEGAKFDRAYMELVSVRQQQAEVQQYQRAVQSIADPAVKAWAERQLPALREQQAAALRLGGKGTVAQPTPVRVSRAMASRAGTRSRS